MRIRGLLWREGENGLGVNILGFHPKLPYSVLFDKPARQHDRMYDNGGDGWNRAFYDEMFGQWMWRYSHTVSQRIFCIIYYISVRLFGWLFFNYTKRQ